MKTKLLLLFLILFSNFTSGITAGTTNNILNFNKCDYLIVSVEGELPINTSEYILIGCSEVTTNEWYCDCYNNYDLKIQTNLRTINTYNLKVTYFYKGDNHKSHNNFYYYRDYENSKECNDSNKQDSKPIIIEKNETIYKYVNNTIYINDTVTHEIIQNSRNDIWIYAIGLLSGLIILEIFIKIKYYLLKK